MPQAVFRTRHASLSTKAPGASQITNERLMGRAPGDPKWPTVSADDREGHRPALFQLGNHRATGQARSIKARTPGLRS